MHKQLLFEKLKNDPIHGIDSLLMISDNDAVSARRLIEGIGKRFFISIDGTSKNLREIVKWDEVPIDHQDAAPFLYRIELGKPFENT